MWIWSYTFLSLVFCINNFQTAYEPGHTDAVIDIVQRHHYDVNMILPYNGLTLFMVWYFHRFEIHSESNIELSSFELFRQSIYQKDFWADRVKVKATGVLLIKLITFSDSFLAVFFKNISAYGLRKSSGRAVWHRWQLALTFCLPHTQCCLGQGLFSMITLPKVPFEHSMIPLPKVPSSFFYPCSTMYSFLFQCACLSGQGKLIRYMLDKGKPL